MKGRVVDEQGAPLSNVKIFVQDKAAAVTDELG